MTEEENTVAPPSSDSPGRRRRFTSTHVLAEFYRRAQDAGLEVWCGHQARNYQGRKCRFSAVIVVAKQIVAIVACKSSPNAARRVTRQRSRYESFGLPVVWVRGLDAIPAALLEAKRIAVSCGAELLDSDVSSALT